MCNRAAREEQLLYGEWQKRLAQLRAQQVAIPKGGASLFYGGTLANGRVSVLLVGKATGGWDDDSNPPRATEEFLAHCLDSYHSPDCGHVKRKTCPPYHSHFWHFAAELARAVASEGGCPFYGLAWTNLAKIAPTARGNAGLRLFREQHGLAVETLKAEIRYHQPGVVVFATCGYHDKAVFEILGLQGWDDFECDKDHTCGWVGRRGGRPPALVTQHPQGKPRETRCAWVAKARELASAQ